jgi:large subunit ribosomal protein L30
MTQPDSTERGLVVTQVRSAIGSKPKHRATLRALGLKRVGATRTVADRPEIRGMLSAVSHLVEVHNLNASPPKSARRRSEEAK